MSAHAAARHRAVRIPRDVTADLAVGLGLAAAAALIYALSFHPDWIFDPLRYAELMQRGPVRVLLGPQHALGNLLPLAAFRLLRGVGYDGQAMAVLAAFAVAGATATVAAVFWAARGLGGSRTAAALAAAVLAVTAFMWRAGGSGGVYGVAAATLALGWLAAARFVRRGDARSAAWLGAAAGVAVGGHLENLAFAAAAAVIVLALHPRDGSRQRVVLAFAAVAAAVTVSIFVITAGVATGWSLAGMRDWFLHPGIGGSADRSSQVGWGIAGLLPSVASGQPTVRSLPFGLDAPNGHLQFLVVLALLMVTIGRGVLLATRSRSGLVLTAALTINAGLAFLLASWHQALRADYWGLGLVPLAIMAGAGTRTVSRRAARLRWVGAAAAFATVGVLIAWNASREVAPSLSVSRARGTQVAALEQRLPHDTHVLMTLILAGRLADDGYRAEGGFAALKHLVDAGAAPPAIDALVREAATRPVVVSRAAFGFTEGQATFLGVTGKDVWRQLHECCWLQPLIRIGGFGRLETLYRVVVRGA